MSIVKPPPPPMQLIAKDGFGVIHERGEISVEEARRRLEENETMMRPTDGEIRTAILVIVVFLLICGAGLMGIGIWLFEHLSISFS